MSVTAYPTLRLKLTMPQALKLQFLPAIPGFNASQAAAIVANKVNRPGDTMTGFLTANADPTAPLHYATKQYVDAHAGSGSLSLSASQLAGRGAASGTGVPEAITLGTNLTMSGTTLNATGGSGGGAPTDAEYVVAANHAGLSAERLLTNTASVTWDFTTPGQVKANSTGGGREILTAARSYFVRTDGSDSNNGLANTAGGAFLTIQKGIDTACALDMSVFSAQVRVADGTYNVSGATAMRLKTYVGAGPIGITGNAASPQNVIISVTGGDCVGAAAVMGQYNINGFTLRCNTAGFACMRAGGGPTFVNIINIRWDIAAYHVFSDYAAQVFCLGTQEIIGDASVAHLAFTNKGIIQNAGKTITLTGARTFGQGFVLGNNNGLLVASGLVFAGPVPTGKKFTNDTLALIITGSGDVNYFPGTIPGTTWSGGYF